MAACCFLGQRDCLDTIKTRLREVLVQLIERDGADQFTWGTREHLMRLCAPYCVIQKV